MIAFAGNSLLCRLALRQTRIDAASFTTIRIISGAAVLSVMAAVRYLNSRRSRAGMTISGSWASALALFAYAAAFSFAYVSLSAGTGALLLFGAVQMTMILWGVYKGERLRPRQLFGFVGAFAGLVALLLPGISAPPLSASVLMLIAGCAWGVYSRRGKGAADPVGATTGNFLRAVPLTAALSVALLA